MARTTTTRLDTTGSMEGAVESVISAVSWPAIIGGALAAIAVSLILLVLGSGLGLSAVSPWNEGGISPTTFTVTTAIWLIIMQWLSSGLGGYLSGRLRTKWAGIHTDEVFFRDTVHGFLAWSLATIVTAAFLASATASVVSGGVKAATEVASSAAVGAGQAASEVAAETNLDEYFTDRLLRTDFDARDSVVRGDARGEIDRLFAHAGDGEIAAEDKAYLARLIADRTGLSEAEATNRVEMTLAEMNEAKQKALEVAEEAQEAATTLSIFTALSMLVGAFIASVAAAIGGRHRDMW